MRCAGIHGGLIYTCLVHGSPGTTFRWDRAPTKTPAQLYADWYYGKTKGGNSSLYIDYRGPNADGLYNGTANRIYAKCAPFPGDGRRHPPSPTPSPPTPPTPPPSPSGNHEPCPRSDGKGCASCATRKDGRCPGKWCNQPCVHLSQPVGRNDCQPASWWMGQKSNHPGIKCVGNATGCTSHCNAL